MKFLISKEFKFDAAHNLTRYKGKCEKLHGHTYRLKVTLSGDIGQDDMVVDFGDIKEIVNRLVISKLDHAYLNELIDNPTAENIAVWVWNQLKDALQGPNYRLYSITVWETETSYVELIGTLS